MKGGYSSDESETKDESIRNFTFIFCQGNKNTFVNFIENAEGEKQQYQGSTPIGSSQVHELLDPLLNHHIRTTNKITIDGSEDTEPDIV